jgi:hypothetical protein
VSETDTAPQVAAGQTKATSKSQANFKMGFIRAPL